MSFENKSMNSSNEPSLHVPVQTDNESDQAFVDDRTSQKELISNEPSFHSFSEPSLQNPNSEEVVEDINRKVSKILKLVENPQKVKSSKFWVFLAISQLPFSITTIMDHSPAFKEFCENNISDIIDIVSGWIN